MRIELNCAECGKNRFNLADGPDDEARICCDSCGHVIGTMSELKERVAAEVLRLAAKRDATDEG
jgi:uncharacterized Zn finger protein